MLAFRANILEFSRLDLQKRRSSLFLTSVSIFFCDNERKLKKEAAGVAWHFNEILFIGLDKNSRDVTTVEALLCTRRGVLFFGDIW